MSWCKLEVEVTTPKGLLTASAEGQPQEVPPLVVAALNLKTRFNAQVCYPTPFCLGLSSEGALNSSPQSTSYIPTSVRELPISNDNPYTGC